MLLTEITQAEENIELNQLRELLNTQFSTAYKQLSQAESKFLRGASRSYIDRFAGTVIDPTQHKRASRWSKDADYTELLENLTTFPGWENIHPRLHSVIGTPSGAVASSWGSVIVVLPENGSTISVAPDDFNSSIFKNPFNISNRSERYHINIPSNLHMMMKYIVGANIDRNIPIPTTYEELEESLTKNQTVFDQILRKIKNLPPHITDGLKQVSAADSTPDEDTVRKLAYKITRHVMEDPNQFPIVGDMLRILISRKLKSTFDPTELLNNFTPKHFNIRTIPLEQLTSTEFEPTTELWTSNKCLIVTREQLHKLNN